MKTRTAAEIKKLVAKLCERHDYNYMIADRENKWFAITDTLRIFVKTEEQINNPKYNKYFVHWLPVTCDYIERGEHIKIIKRKLQGAV